MDDPLPQKLNFSNDLLTRAKIAQFGPDSRRGPDVALIMAILMWFWSEPHRTTLCISELV